MVEYLNSLPTWAGCIVMTGFTAVAGFVVYLVFYKFISKYKREGIKDATSNIFRVVGMLVSLVLALAFSEVIGELRTIRKSIVRESVAISDIYQVLELFDIEETRELQTILVDYTQAVSLRAGALKRQLVEGVINLKPATPAQEKMFSHILSDIDALSDHRINRLDSALAEPPVYLYVLIFGFLVTMACFGVYRPQAPLVVLVWLYTVFVGLMLFLVLQLSDPFQGDIGVAPTSFEYLVETLHSEIR